MKLPEINPTGFLDIGANVGEWTRAAHQKWPQARAHMFEANQNCAPALIQNEFSGAGINFSIAALSSIKGHATLYGRKDAPTATGDSLYRELTEWYSEDKIERKDVETYPLDYFGFFEGYDLIKIDTQGSELDILKGATETLKQIKWIILEVAVPHSEPYNDGAPTHDEVIEYMSSIGFWVVEVLEDIVHPIGRHVIQQDILFERV